MTHSNTSTPFLEDVINNYLEAGWPMLTAMPQGAKYPPLTDNTGRKAFHDRQIALAGYEWDESDNVGLVLATEDSAGFDLIALDVDQYDDKTGADSLAELEGKIGTLNLDDIPRSTRRGIDSRSAQYFFKVPKGYEYNGYACDNVEIVQAHHRFSAVYPSIVDDMQYRWYQGNAEAEIPNVDDLPWLPEAWLKRLIKGSAKEADPKADPRSYKDAMDWLENRVFDGEPEPLEVSWEKGSRHDTMRDKAHALVQGAVFEGKIGSIPALKELRAEFKKAKPEAPSNAFPDAVVGSVAKAEGAISEGAPDVNWRVFNEELKAWLKDFGDPIDWGFKDQNGEPLDLSPDMVALIKQKLTHTGEGEVKSTPKNYRIIIEETPEFQSICFNEHSGRIEVLQPKELPWNSNGTNFDGKDFKLLRQVIGEDYGISSKDGTENALEMVANKRSYHPIQDYFDRLVWDGNPRLDTLFIDTLDAEDNTYTREATAKIFIAAAARTFNPGTKFDQMLVLVGKQGAGKSTILKKMGKQWFTDQLSVTHMKDSKKAGEQIEGKLIVEVGELAGLRKADAEVVKSYISAEVDRFRAAYGGNAEDRPRQAVLFGTTNESSGFLLDTTGNRRFWPVHVGATNADRVFALTDSEIDQVWAEAVQRFRAGENLNLSKKAAELALGAQSEAMADDERAGLVEHYLNHYPSRFKNVRDPDLTCGLEIWLHALHGDRDEFNSKEAKDMKRILLQIEGWEETGQRQRLGTFGKQYSFKRVK